MKTVKKNGEIKRIRNEEVNNMIGSGWAYCTKSEWKKNVRDKDRKVETPKVPVKEAVKSKDPGKGSKYRNKKAASNVTQAASV